MASHFLNSKQNGAIFTSLNCFQTNVFGSFLPGNTHTFGVTMPPVYCNNLYNYLRIVYNFLLFVVFFMEVCSVSAKC